MDELGAKDDQLAEFVESSNAVFATLARQDANLRATLRELPPRSTRRRRRSARPTRSPTSSGPTLAGAAARRPRARPDAARRCARSCARRRRSSATRSARSRARRARPSRELRPALRDLARRDAGPHAHLRGRQHAAQHARLQPARQARRATCSGSSWAEPHRRHGLRHPGRARPDPPRPRSSPPARTCRCSTSVCAGQPAARHARPTCSSHARSRSARSTDRRTPRGGGYDAEGRPLLRPRSPSWSASRCRASACCCSCGSRSAARSR